MNEPTEILIIEDKSKSWLEHLIKTKISYGWKLQGQIKITHSPQTFWYPEKTIYTQVMIK